MFERKKNQKNSTLVLYTTFKAFKIILNSFNIVLPMLVSICQPAVTTRNTGHHGKSQSIFLFKYIYYNWDSAIVDAMFQSKLGIEKG